MTQISKRGFTLIELLVVISIIGVLATLIMANFVGVRERARDAQRKSDLNQIQKALEMYKNAQAIPSYPAGTSFAAMKTALEAGDFMKTVPNDPNCPGATCTGSSINYQYSRNAADSLKYTIIACLENASDPQKDTTVVGGCTTSLSRSEP